ncbi:cytochrome P450 [Actinomadura hibisca]|uniref:cytochrome P450 n=1 Tax=Actinomadura hibisca TaxID=68565 RepID=UPI0008374BFE|nr:cytochrome P450 [Actinomadura hibisca]
MSDPVVTAEPYVRWDAEAQAHVVTGHEEALAVLRGDGWSSDPRDNPLAPPELRDAPPGLLLFMNAPEHTRLRGFLSPAFTPRAIEGLRPRIATIVEAVLDGLDGPDADVLADVGQIVPLAVIAELLDAGTDGAELFLRCTPDLFRFLEIGASAEDLRRATEAATELSLFLTPLIAERVAMPGPDLISAMLAVPDGPSIAEVYATCLLLLTAGHETTANLIANGTHAVLTTPGGRAALLADPDRAVAEIVRLEGSVKLIGRTATADHLLDGHRVAAGEFVLLRLDEIARDPRLRADPQRRDLGRDPGQSLAFGAGAHFCLGHALALVETTETLVRLFTRFPALRLAGAVQPLDSSTFHRLRSLPVSLY